MASVKGLRWLRLPVSCMVVDKFNSEMQRLEKVLVYIAVRDDMAGYYFLKKIVNLPRDSIFLIALLSTISGDKPRSPGYSRGHSRRMHTPWALAV